MKQVIPGISLGSGVYVFQGGYDPNTATDFGVGISLPPANIALGSLFLRTDTGGLYVKTAQPNGWTAK